ncbi:MAG: hypothetical protein NVSMB51_12870 [Solirubrobacteraceae bacterium]
MNRGATPRLSGVPNSLPLRYPPQARVRLERRIPPGIMPAPTQLQYHTSFATRAMGSISAAQRVTAQSFYLSHSLDTRQNRTATHHWPVGVPAWEPVTQTDSWAAPRRTGIEGNFVAEPQGRRPSVSPDGYRGGIYGGRAPRLPRIVLRQSVAPPP